MAGPLQTAVVRQSRVSIERWLEAERDQLILWAPVMLGAGIAAWFLLPDPQAWIAAALAATALASFALAFARGGRGGLVLGTGATLFAAGLLLVWARAELVAAPVLARTSIARFTATIERVDMLPARELVRLRLRILTTEQGKPLPPRIRVNLAQADAPAGLAAGQTVRMRARLMPPAEAALPGAYDFARAAWFTGIGATGRAFAPLERVGAGQGETTRAALSRHIHARLPGSIGGIAAALATGDTGAIAEDDAEAMRRSGLAHLLSVSGLHITAVVAFAMLATIRLLALSPWLALHWRLPLVAAAVGAAAAVGYTWLTGSEVPTLRSCIAALLVLVALAMGREALTLRLVAAGAFVVLLVYPESLAGPSFQLSFAAVTAIVALHEHPRIRRWFLVDEARWPRRAAAGLASLLLTGLLVEAALMPIAVYHFHKAGLYGAAANIVAIPLTTFVVMPLEAIALLLDAIGLGAPVWWLAGQALTILLWIARTVAAAPGAVAALPAMPAGAFAAMVMGGLWLALWRTRARTLGLIPMAIGALWALATPAPDLLVTGDGRHAAIRTDSGIAMLRDRAGDYVQDMLAENGGVDGAPALLAEQPGARCSRDLCLAERIAGGRRWRILLTRSAYLVPVRELIAACHAADIVVSERRLPRNCHPRWLRLDRPTLARTGGVAISLADATVRTVRTAGDRHPWIRTQVDDDPAYDRRRAAVRRPRAGAGNRAAPAVE